MSFFHQRFGYRGYSFLLLLTLLLAPLAVAQTDTNQAPAKPTESSSVQARIRARRQQRLAQLINEIYGRKYEAYFGGGYLRFLPGDLQHINEALWNVGVTDYLKNKWGVTADFRGLYGTAYTYNNPNDIHLPQIYQYSFMGGPQYRFYKRPHVAVSGRALIGAMYGNFNGDTRGLGSTLRLYPDGTAFAANLGAPVDFNLSPQVAIRVTPEYFLTTFGSTTQNNLGFTAGVVYRFGKTSK